MECYICDKVLLEQGDVAREIAVDEHGSTCPICLACDAAAKESSKKVTLRSAENRLTQMGCGVMYVLQLSAGNIIKVGEKVDGTFVDCDGRVLYGRGKLWDTDAKILGEVTLKDPMKFLLHRIFGEKDLTLEI